jgi:hypothetical protein
MGEILVGSIPEYGWEVILRRLAVLERPAEICGSWHLGWVDNGIKDSDGAAGIWTPTVYQPWTEAYWDAEEEIDYGLIHETLHRVPHLPDIYCLMWDWRRTAEGGSGSGIGGWPVEAIDMMLLESDGRLNRLGLSREELVRRKEFALSRDETELDLGNLPLPLEDIPEDWLAYSLWERNDDRGRGLMSVRMDQGLSSYSTWILRRRVVQRWLHNDRLAIPEASWRYPYEVADNNIFVLGSEFNGAQVEVWRSEGNDHERTGLTRVFDGRVSGGEVDVGDPFETVDFHEGMIPVAQGLLLLKVYDGNEVHCRYVGIGDFSIGIDPSTYHPRFRGTLRMEMELGSSETSPRDLDWEIDYEYHPADVYHVYAPLGLKNSGP